MNKNIDLEGWETNRYKKLRVNTRKSFWCSCDKEKICKGEKCSLKINRVVIGGGKRKLKHYL
jgi:hypothetical protein